MAVVLSGSRAVWPRQALDYGHPLLEDVDGALPLINPTKPWLRRVAGAPSAPCVGTDSTLRRGALGPGPRTTRWGRMRGAAALIPPLGDCNFVMEADPVAHSL